MTPARLRAWILVFTGVLVVAIVLFLGYGRWQGRRFGHDRPDGLATTVQQSTNGFTYSESRGGHTMYTLHASKAVQYKSGGHAVLHDVSITLYDGKGAPANRIYGSDFDWDPASGTARAMGEVQIDLQATTASGSQATAASADESESKNTVHIKTSGLIFNKQQGVASTTERLEFRLAEAAGSAVGASFDSQSGIVILDSQVAFNSSVGGNPLQVRARHAQFDRNSRLLYLLQDVSDYADSHSSSDQATVSFRADGSAYQIDAQGNVILSGSQGQQVNTRQVHLDLGPKSELQQAILDGGVLYVANSPARLLHGTASSATLTFASQPATIRHAQLRDAVSLVDEEKLPAVDAARSRQNAPETTTRQVGASKVDVDFAPGQGDPVAQHILAAGSARLNIHELYAKTPPQDTTVQGDQLFATLTDEEVLSSLRGTGHTSLAIVSPNGNKQTSTGDSLLLTFQPPPATAATAKLKVAANGSTPAAQPAAQLQSALQVGNVTLVQEPAEKPGGQPATPSTATAERASYDAATQIVQLSGNPRIRDASGDLTASLIEMERITGNGNATGGVKATYRQVNGQQATGHQDVAFTGTGPVHVVADHAHLDHQADITTFYGAAHNQARMFQGSDSVAAPVLELSRKNATMSAHGSPGDAATVNAVFTSTSSSARNPPSVVRLQSRTLLYADNEHKAVFSGNVVAQMTTGVLHANFMDVYFSPAAAAQPQGPQLPSQPTQSSHISRIVARGAVELQQPGRKGSGEELEYTAQDGKFVLTGTAAAPPRLADQVRGTVTGSSLIFNDHDDSVLVSGGPSKAVTQTRVAK